MAKDDSGFTYTYSQLWSAWAQQPIEIQRQWMVWKVNKDTGEESGLKPVLENIMQFCPRERDEVFMYAPKDIQDFFGYVAIADKREVVKPSRYNPNRQVAVKKPVYSSTFPEITLQERERIQRILEA